MHSAHDARQEHRLRSILQSPTGCLAIINHTSAFFHVLCRKNNSVMDHPIDIVCVCVCVCVRARARARINTLTSRVASEQKGIDYITRSRHAARRRYVDYVTAIRRVSKTRAHTAIYLPFLLPPAFLSRIFIMLQLFCDSGRLTANTRCTNL